MVPSDGFYCVFILFRWSVKCNIVICFVIFLRVPGTGGSRECPLFSLNVCMIPGTNPSLLTFICNSTINPDGAFWVICRSGQSTENCAHSQLWLYFSLSLCFHWIPWQKQLKWRRACSGSRSRRLGRKVKAAGACGSCPSHFHSQQGESTECIQAALSPFSTNWKEYPSQGVAPPTGTQEARVPGHCYILLSWQYLPLISSLPSCSNSQVIKKSFFLITLSFMEVFYILILFGCCLGFYYLKWFQGNTWKN